MASAASAVDLSGLNAVTFDAAALVGYGTSNITVVANRLVLENTASTFSEPVGASHGGLKLTATELALGEGAKALRRLRGRGPDLSIRR